MPFSPEWLRRGARLGVRAACAAQPLAWFHGYASRRPSRARAAFTVLLGGLLTIGVWDRRGAVAGLVALAVYGVVFALAAFRHEAVSKWSEAHPVLDSALLAPLAFLALAYLTRLGLVTCALIGLGAWLLLLPLVLGRRARASAQ